MSLTIIAGAAFATTFGLLVERWWRHRRVAEQRLRIRAWIRRLKAQERLIKEREEKAKKEELWHKQHEEMSKKEQKKLEAKRRAREEEIRKYWEKQAEKDKKKQKEDKKKRKKEEKKQKKKAWKEFKKQWEAKREFEASQNKPGLHDWYYYGHPTAHGHWTPGDEPLVEEHNKHLEAVKRPLGEEAKKSDRIMDLLRDPELIQDLDEDTIRELIQQETEEQEKERSGKKEQSQHHRVETSSPKKKSSTQEEAKAMKEGEEQGGNKKKLVTDESEEQEQSQRPWSRLTSRLLPTKKSLLDWTEPTTFLIVLCVALAVAFSASAPPSTGYSSRPGVVFNTSSSMPGSASPSTSASFLRGISLLKALSAWDSDIESLKAGSPEQGGQSESKASTTPASSGSSPLNTDFYQFTVKLLADENSEKCCKCDETSSSSIIPPFLEVRNWLQNVNNTEVRW